MANGKYLFVLYIRFVVYCAGSFLSKCHWNWNWTWNWKDKYVHIIVLELHKFIHINVIHHKRSFIKMKNLLLISRNNGIIRPIPARFRALSVAPRLRGGFF